MADTFEIEFDGATFHGETAGFGLPVVFLHAGVADRRMWQETMREAAAAGYHVMAYDRRGFGETTTDDVEFSHVIDLEAVLDRLGMNAVVLVGCSMGGALAVDFTLEYPARAVALVLVSSWITGAEPEMPPEVEELEEQLAYAMETGNTRRANKVGARLWLDGPAGLEGRVTDPARELFSEMNRIALEHPRLTKEEASPPAMDNLHTIEAPVLLVAGELDGSDTLDRHDELEELFPNAFAITLDGVAHLPPLEAPEVFTPVLLEFLEAVTAVEDEED